MTLIIPVPHKSNMLTRQIYFVFHQEERYEGEYVILRVFK